MWNVDIKAKYIAASLVIVLSIFETSVPWCIDAMGFVCTRTDAKTKTSKETGRWFSSRNGEIRKSGEMLTEGEAEGILKDQEGLVNPDKTYVIRIQRKIKHICCWKCALSSGAQACVCDEVEVLTLVRCGPNDHVDPNTELHDANCIQNACDPFLLPRYSVNSVMVRVSERIQVDEETSNL